MNRKSTILIGISLAIFAANAAAAEEPAWTFVLHASDIIAGPTLEKLRTRHHWRWRFEQDGTFEIALRKATFPAPAPRCRMPYLILAMPSYYPENPKQSPLPERRAVYDALLTMQGTGTGTLRVRTEGSYYVRQGASGPELTTCNVYFVLPLESLEP